MTDQLSLPFQSSIDGDSIRRAWHNEQWFYSIIDIIAELMEADKKAARNYYTVLKHRLQTEGNEILLNVMQLKLLAPDGKQRLTDVVSTEQALRIIQTIPSPKAEPMKLWLAKIGTERLQETEDPELGLFLALDRVAGEYRRAGKTDDWIEVRIEGIITRKQFIEALRVAVMDAPPTMYALTTEKMYRGLWERTTAQLRNDLAITDKENPRDHFGKYALMYTQLAEFLAKERLGDAETVKFSQALDIIWEVAKLFRSQARQLSKAVGYDLVTGKPLLPNPPKPPRKLRPAES